MGLFKAKLTLASVTDPDRTIEFDGLVDTGAIMSFVPRSVLEFLGSPNLGQMRFRCADGRIIERELGVVIARYDGQQAGVSVVFAEDGDQSIIGVTTLEVLSLAVDPDHQKLVPTIGYAL